MIGWRKSEDGEKFDGINQCKLQNEHIALKLCPKDI